MKKGGIAPIVRKGRCLVRESVEGNPKMRERQKDLKKSTKKRGISQADVKTQSRLEKPREKASSKPRCGRAGFRETGRKVTSSTFGSQEGNSPGPEGI